ncbi:MAG TPA: terminase family protein [Candidatus Bathyarchaeia archaeon]|nr:terminase family protein [Candidatus Bathyarchaeia archaeon]
MNVPEEAVEFCEKLLSFKPTKYQNKVLNDKSQFIVIRWCRQSGKSHIIAALILFQCLRNREFNVLVVSPSLRQSKIIIRKISSFLRRLPKYVAPKPLQTKIEFHNGSRVQAFPNNPETIRGEPGVNLVFIDEYGFVRDDADLLDAVVFTLATTNGKFLATSTPGSRDSVFYRMCTDNDTYGDVSRHHISWREALEPNGPLKEEILEKLRKQIESVDPWRWQREMEAEFAEDEDAWLPMSLITKSIRQDLEPIPDDFYTSSD